MSDGTPLAPHITRRLGEMETRTSTATSVGDIGTLTQSFLRACRAENLSPSTIEVYGSALERFTRSWERSQR